MRGKLEHLKAEFRAAKAEYDAELGKYWDALFQHAAGGGRDFDYGKKHEPGQAARARMEKLAMEIAEAVCQ